jgi:hypothetical protein
MQVVIFLVSFPIVDYYAASSSVRCGHSLREDEGPYDLSDDGRDGHEPLRGLPVSDAPARLLCSMRS